VWIRQLMKALATDGRTILVSSHLMNEMAVTADHLIVIGRGRLQADMPVGRFIAQFSDSAVLVRTPQSEQLLAAVGEQQGWKAARSEEQDRFIVTGATAAQIGELAAHRGLVLHELTPQRASLEEAFMELTREAGEFAHQGSGQGAPAQIPGQPAGGTTPSAPTAPPAAPESVQEVSDGR